MGSAFHQLCPRYSGTLTPTAPTAIKLWDTFTFYMLGGKVIYKYLFLFNIYYGPSKIEIISIYGKKNLMSEITNSNDS